MAAINVTISGVLADKYNRTIMPVTLYGEMSYTGLGVGGGPIIPPGGGDKPPGSPPGIWPGPGDPDYPGGGKPPGGGDRPGIWPGPGDPDYPGGGKPPDGPPPDVSGPPVQWKAVWHPVEGWVVVGLINPDIQHPVPST